MTQVRVLHCAEHSLVLYGSRKGVLLCRREITLVSCLVACVQVLGLWQPGAPFTNKSLCCDMWTDVTFTAGLAKESLQTRLLGWSVEPAVVFGLDQHPCLDL